MDRTAIEKIVELGAPNYHEENGYKYSDKQLHIIQEPRVPTLTFHTLDGLIYALRAEYKKFNGPLLVDVEDEETVTVCSAISTIDRQREVPYKVRAELVEIPFGCKLEHLVGHPYAFKKQLALTLLGALCKQGGLLAALFGKAFFYQLFAVALALLRDQPFFLLF